MGVPVFGHPMSSGLYTLGVTQSGMAPRGRGSGATAAPATDVHAGIDLDPGAPDLRRDVQNCWPP